MARIRVFALCPPSLNGSDTILQMLSRRSFEGSRRAKRILLGLFCGAWCALPQQSAPPDPLLAWMDRIAQTQLQRRESAVAEVRTVADAERRKKLVRETVLSLLGGLPDNSGPLNP